MFTDTLVSMAERISSTEPFCLCGHPKEGHIYHEGACRIGDVVCGCEQYVPKVRMMILPRKLDARQQRAIDQMNRIVSAITPEQMEEMLDRTSPGWRDTMPKVEMLPEGDPYWKQRALELAQHVVDQNAEIDRLRTKVISCDCGIIHRAYNDLRADCDEMQERLNKLVQR